jgi:hypothetical protein
LWHVLSTNFKERNDVKEAKMVVVESSIMGGGVSSNGGCKGGGRGSDDGNGRGWSFNGGNNHGRDRVDAYYQNMIEAHPRDGSFAWKLCKVFEGGNYNLYIYFFAWLFMLELVFF